MTGERKTASGTWLVIGLVAAGILAGLAALKFRRHPAPAPPASRPAATVVQ
jgi:hypothetical protein